MASFTNNDAERVRAAAAAVVAEHHLPGISIGVVSGTNLVFCEGFGCADIESREPMDPRRRQRVASITKTMTGFAVMALVDEGKLALDDRVVDRLPEIAFDGPSDRMTIRHLLTHTSGIGEAPTLDRLAATVNPNTAGAAEEDDFALYRHGIVVEGEPGTKWAYANHGYPLLGEIVSRAENAPFADVLRRRIFEPLGMHDSDCTRGPHPLVTTCYHRAPNDDTRELLERAGMPPPEETAVDGYNIRGRAVANDHHGMLAAGAVQSTVPDMAKYAAALLRRGGGIVRPETFDAMIAPQWCPDDRLESWGLSFGRAPAYGRRVFRHGGSYFGGWNSHLTVSPEDDVAVIIHMNVMLDTTTPVFGRIIRAVLDAPAPVLAEAPLSDDVLSAAPGVYECTPGRLTNFRPSTRVGRVQIARDGARGLTFRSRRGEWKEAQPLRGADAKDENFLAIDKPGEAPAYVVLTRNAAGAVDGIRFGELMHMVRNDEVQPWA